MNILRENELAIGRLSVKSAETERLAARLHFERLFAAENFLPPELPPNAALCIRKIRDPQPRVLALNRAGARFSEAWRNSVAREIENFYARAVRPIRQTVPASAESVVFLDESELLACLASDWLCGRLRESWWWRGLFPNLEAAQTVARIWLEAAESAPAALQLLARRNEKANFAAKLQPLEAENLLRRVISVYGLNKIRQVLFEQIDEPQTSFGERRENFAERRSAPAPNATFGDERKFAPWFEIVPETRRISPNSARQNLFGIALTLARAPRVARSNEFARKLQIFKTKVARRRKTEPTMPTISTRITKNAAEIQTSRIVEPKRRGVSRFANHTEIKRETEKRVEIEKHTTFKKSFELEKNEFEPIKTSEISPPEIERGAENNAGETNEFSRRRAPAKNESKTRFIKSKTNLRRSELPIPAENNFAEPAEITEEFSETIIETEFGGVFFLLNLGLYLKLYRDFTEAGEPEIDLNIWDFVAAVGLALIGEKLKRDSVWQLLKHLAGRKPDEDFGADFAAPDDWRISADWLETFPENEKWFWARDGKRLVVRHSENFSVIDVAANADLESQLNDELKIYGKYLSNVGEGAFNDFPATFLDRLNEFIERRLRRALGLPADERIDEVLFARRASVRVSATHLDATFRLADLPLAVRLSGLDRDAGWIPAAGKFVKFHFV